MMKLFWLVEHFPWYVTPVFAMEQGPTKALRSKILDSPVPYVESSRCLWIFQVHLLLFSRSWWEPSWTNLKYTSVANIQKVMKLLKLVDKTF